LRGGGGWVTATSAETMLFIVRVHGARTSRRSSNNIAILNIKLKKKKNPEKQINNDCDNALTGNVRNERTAIVYDIQWACRFRVCFRCFPALNRDIAFHGRLKRIGSLLAIRKSLIKTYRSTLGFAYDIQSYIINPWTLNEDFLHFNTQDARKRILLLQHMIYEVIDKWKITVRKILNGKFKKKNPRFMTK
jgi:hypothetical protein